MGDNEKKNWILDTWNYNQVLISWTEHTYFNDFLFLLTGYSNILHTANPFNHQKLGRYSINLVSPGYLSAAGMQVYIPNPETCKGLYKTVQQFRNGFGMAVNGKIMRFGGGFVWNCRYYWVVINSWENWAMVKCDDHNWKDSTGLTRFQLARRF